MTESEPPQSERRAEEELEHLFEERVRQLEEAQREYRQLMSRIRPLLDWAYEQPTARVDISPSLVQGGVVLGEHVPSPLAQAHHDDAYYDEVRRAVGRGAPTLLVGTSTRSLERSLAKLQAVKQGESPSSSTVTTATLASSDEAQTTDKETAFARPRLRLAILALCLLGIVTACGVLFAEGLGIYLAIIATFGFGVLIGLVVVWVLSLREVEEKSNKAAPSPDALGHQSTVRQHPK